MSKIKFNPNGFGIIRLIGIGGTASVYLAKKNSNNNTYALKTPLLEANGTSSQFQKLIRQEYELIGKFGYPGLVRLYEYNEDDKKAPFLAMEYCRETLAQTGEIRSPEILLNIFSSIAINLYFLKLAGIFHGDLKPHNIFLAGTPDNYSENAFIYSKISDFSLALRAGDNNKRLGIGTIGYAAPETIENGNLDARSDIFSLGIIAYQLATGKHPFMNDETDPVRINSLIRESNPPLANEIKPELPDGFSNLIMSMLNKEPDKRPLDGWAICKTLEKIGAKYPFRKMIRPKHLIDFINKKTTEEILKNEVFVLDDSTIERLLDYCGEDLCALRGILEINFTKGNLCWSDGGLKFNGPEEKIIWPSKLQRENKKTFHRLKYTQKKKAILVAIVGNVEDAKSIYEIIGDKPDRNYITRPILHYLKNNLSLPTVIRFANKMAEIAENQFDNCLMASRLYLKSGNLEKAYTITFDAANNLININSFDSSLKILFSLEKLCLRYDDIDKLKSVLMKIGDIEKLIGEAVQAEKTYLRIVKLYDNQPTDRLLAETYKDLGDLYKMKQQYEDGIDALRKAEKIYSAVGDELELSHTLNNIGNIQTIISQYDEALRNYRHALKIQRKLNIASDVASTLNNMAAIYYYRGAYTRTLRLFGMAASIQRQTGNAGELARSLNNLGCVYHEFGNFNKALDYLGESVILNRRIGSKKEILFNLENLSSVMLSAGRLRESIKYLKEGLQLSKELSDIPHMAIFTCNMAVAQKRMGFYGQALENINEAIKLHDEINNNQHLLICLIETADMHLRLNNFDSAHAFIGKIINLAGAVDDKKALISGYLLKGLAENNTRYINQAINLAEENKASRIKTIGRLRLAKVLLAGGDYQGSLNILNGLLNVFNEQSSDIEAADFFNLFGACYLAAGQVDKAERFFEKGIVLAKNMALLPELINSAFNLGKINAHYKAHETVYNYYRLAAEKLKIMVEDIKDELLKKSFLSTGNITSMAKEIRKLNELLITK